MYLTDFLSLHSESGYEWDPHLNALKISISHDHINQTFVKMITTKHNVLKDRIEKPTSINKHISLIS